jgi:hypothetical protein
MQVFKQKQKAGAEILPAISSLEVHREILIRDLSRHR